MFVFFMLGFLLFIFVPVAYITSLIKPARLNVRSKRNPTGKWRRSHFTILAVLLLLLSIFLMNLGASSDTSDNVESAVQSESTSTPESVGSVEVEPTIKPESIKLESAPTPEPVAIAEVDRAKTLGLTPDEFGKRFVVAAEEFGLDKFPWSKVELSKGSVNDTFTKKIRKDLAMTGVVDKNGELKSITYILGQTDEGDQAALTMLMVGGATARVLNPDLPKEQTSKVASELLMNTAKKFTNGGDSVSDSVVVDGVKYGVTASDVIGLWLYFEAVD